MPGRCRTRAFMVVTGSAASPRISFVHLFWHSQSSTTVFSTMATTETCSLQRSSHPLTIARMPSAKLRKGPIVSRTVTGPPGPA